MRKEKRRRDRWMGVISDPEVLMVQVHKEPLHDLFFSKTGTKTEEARSGFFFFFWKIKCVFRVSRGVGG